MKAIIARTGGQAQFAQELVGPAHFPVLSLHGLQPDGNLRRRPGRRPVSCSAFFTHSFSVCAVQPVLAATSSIVAQLETGWATCWENAQAVLS
ncbi:MAG: hypothetical protein H7345_08420 [Rubritepida sp.]|nr:hypothetical protein [Rubritepida sp.]